VYAFPFCSLLTTILPVCFSVAVVAVAVNRVSFFRFVEIRYKSRLMLKSN
jgi:hypothetical protein